MARTRVWVMRNIKSRAFFYRDENAWELVTQHHNMLRASELFTVKQTIVPGVVTLGVATETCDPRA